MAGLFQVLQGQPDGTFRKAAALNGTDDEPLIIPIENSDAQLENICTRPFAVDWDADSDLDLVVGNFAGSFYLFRGEGEGRFLPEPEPLMAGDEPLKLANFVIEEGSQTTARMAHHSDPFTVDWDGDGDLDLLSGTSIGGVQWAENKAGFEKPPELEPFRWLIEPGLPVASGQLLSESDLTGPLSATRIWVDDVNSDGKLDILVGDRVTLVSPAAGLSPDEYQEKLAAWQKASEAAVEELSATDDDDQEQRAKAIQRYSEVYRQRADFMNEEWTGFVWLYVQN